MLTSEAETSAQLVSPFSGLSTAEPLETTVERELPQLQTPFLAGYASESGATTDRQVGELLDQLADEDFADTVAGLVDEAATQHLVDQGAWTAPPTTAESRLSLEAWIEPLAAASERAIDQLSERVGGIDPLAIGGQELGELLDSVTPEQLGIEGFDNFLGGLLKKVKKAVGGAVDLVKKGVAVVGKFMPINLLLNKLKGLVRPLLNRVLRAALNLLPASVRPVAQVLAKKLGLGEAEQLDSDPVTRLAEDFDLEIAGLLYADTTAELPEAEAEEELESAPVSEDGRLGTVAELDAARAQLAARLTELPAGTPPVAELEQFIPAVMAVRPLIKLAVSMIGRDKIVRFLAERIAGLIKGLVGAEAATMVSRPLVDVGLRMLGFEVPAEEERTLAGEALASTVEGTVLRVLELPGEAFADELQLDAAVQQAFAEAAAAAMPDRLLHPDLPERETEKEGGVWVLMPRAARPRYRYRRYARVFVVPISRQVARAVRWSDGGSLEGYLLDAGASRWPVQAEVELYEAMPGTHIGHLGGEPGEVQPLTPETAGLLLREPGLGRGGPATPRALGARPQPGQRYFRVRPAGLAARRTGRPHRRVFVDLDATPGRPVLRIGLRLSERQAQSLLTQVQGTKPNLPGALAALQRYYATALPTTVVQRLLRRSVVPDAAKAGAIADRVTAAVTTALSNYLTERSAQLATAARDPANGMTITVAFPGVSPAALADAPLPAGQVSVQPGWPRRA
jgi:histone H3/H4